MFFDAEPWPKHLIDLPKNTNLMHLWESRWRVKGNFALFPLANFCPAAIGGEGSPDSITGPWSHAGNLCSCGMGCYIYGTCFNLSFRGPFTCSIAPTMLVFLGYLLDRAVPCIYILWSANGDCMPSTVNCGRQIPKGFLVAFWSHLTGSTSVVTYSCRRTTSRLSKLKGASPRPVSGDPQHWSVPCTYYSVWGWVLQQWVFSSKGRWRSPPVKASTS